MLEALWSALIGFAEWVLKLVKDVFIAVWDFCVDAVCYVFDKALQVAVDLANGLDVSRLNIGDTWGTLPAEVLNILGLIGFGQCMGIIAAAIVIRLTLQLIPFVRLGS